VVFPHDEDQEEVKLRAKVDQVISQSIISSAKAKDTGHEPRPCKTSSIKDADGHTYTSSSFVPLRWRKQGDMRTQDEDFYIVDDIGLDVMFAKSAIQERYGTNTHPLLHAQQTEGMRFRTFNV
jgi:hypothetical protein